MTSNPMESVDSRRFVEIDAVLKRLNLAIAAVVAGAAPLFVHRFGVYFFVFTLLPIIWWIARLGLRIDRSIGLRAWNAGLVAVMIVAIVGGSATSGGVASPVVFFAGLVGLFAQATFTDLRYSKVGGLVVVGLVAMIDLALQRPIDLFDCVAAVLIAGYLPLCVRRLVDVEQIQRRSAVLDVLTGCLNRRSFEQRAAEIDAQALRTGQSVSVISFDIDHFKSVNDDHGHAAGDQVLENIAYVARKQLRRFELMFRLGGEEFVVLLPGTDIDIAVSIAERLRSHIEAATSNGISVTASFGVAIGSGCVEDVLARADERLYRAKESGRNRVVGPDHPEMLASPSLIVHT